MIGGYFDGAPDMPVPDDRETWLLPVPVQVNLGPEPDVTMLQINTQRYCWTGSIKDDGTRIFRAT